MQAHCLRYCKALKTNTQQQPRTRWFILQSSQRLVLGSRCAICSSIEDQRFLMFSGLQLQVLLITCLAPCEQLSQALDVWKARQVRRGIQHHGNCPAKCTECHCYADGDSSMTVMRTCMHQDCTSWSVAVTNSRVMHLDRFFTLRATLKVVANPDVISGDL